MNSGPASGVDGKQTAALGTLAGNLLSGFAPLEIPDNVEYLGERCQRG